MKEISLTQGKVALVDDGDFERLSQFRWCADKGSKTYYAASTFLVNGKSCKVRMHSEIIGKASKGIEIDHRDGNGLNNQKHNLRFATRRQNLQNIKNISKVSRFPGVCWDKSNKNWVARIRINGGRKYLGRFASEAEAFNAYRFAVESLGEKMIGT